MSGPVWERYRNTICIVVLLLLSLLMWAPRLRGPVDLRYDAGVYYVLGTSLAEGKGYRLLNEPGEIQAVQYPPLLPLFAAAHQRLAGTSDPAVVGPMLRVSFFAIFLAFIVGVYQLSKCYLTPGLALLATLVTLLHRQTIWMSELFFTELPFALLSVLFLLAMRPQKGRPRQWLAGTLAIACFLLRSSGIVVLGAWVGDSLLRRRSREAALRASVALVCVFGWQGYIASVTQAPDYANPAYEYQRAGYQYYNVGYLQNLAYVDPFVPELGAVSPPLLLKRITANLFRTPADVGAAISIRPARVTARLKEFYQRLGVPQAPTYIGDYLPFAALGALVFYGLALLAIRGEWALVLYTIGTTGLICLTPWPGQSERYWWPLTPILAIAFLTGLLAIAKRLSTVNYRWARAGSLAVVGVSMVGVLSIEAVSVFNSYALHDDLLYRDSDGKAHEYGLFFYGPSWSDHDQTLDWLTAHANPGEVVATSAPHWAYLKTGLQAVMPPFEPDRREAQRLMDSVPVSYLVVDGLGFVDISRRYAAPVVEAFPAGWELVYGSTEDSSRIYRRSRRSSHPGTSTGGGGG